MISFLKEMLLTLLAAAFFILVNFIVIVLVIRKYPIPIFLRPKLMTLIIEERCGLDSNQIYIAATKHLNHLVTYSPREHKKVSKTNSQPETTFEITSGNEIIDIFKNTELKWKLIVSEKGEYCPNPQKIFELSFDKKFRECVLESYLPMIINRYERKPEIYGEVKLYTKCLAGDYGYSHFRSINFEHPATFENLAMDPELRMMLMDDLDKFTRSKGLYNKVGKVWKRGYLFYGPAGTGKSSLIFAMAKYLSFDIYDLELSDIRSDLDLKSIFLSISSCSILVIGDIECAAGLEDRGQENNYKASSTKFTLAGLLNIIDGLWSCCGDGRIIVFTTNHKEKLDPALLRPGRIDVQVHMSYCTMNGFKFLASNYLDIGYHQLYRQIEGLLENVEVTPAEIVEKLSKSGGTDVVLGGLVKFLKQKALQRAIAAESKKLLKSDDDTDVDVDVDVDVDDDVDVEGFLKSIRQEKFKAAAAEQLLKSDHTDFAVEGLVKLTKQKRLEDAEAAEAKCINPNELN